jgi:rSAM-associated Gly-rich repeat protein
MDITTRTGLLGFLLALSALGTAPAGASTGFTPAAEEPSTAAESPSIEHRLSRIAAALRAREAHLTEDQKPGKGLQVAYGFVNRVGPRAFVNGPYRGAFRNVHPYYGGARGFVNGGGGFVNGARYGGGGFVNAPYRGGGAFRNW